MHRSICLKCHGKKTGDGRSWVKVYYHDSVELSAPRRPSIFHLPCPSPELGGPPPQVSPKARFCLMPYSIVIILDLLSTATSLKKWGGLWSSLILYNQVSHVIHCYQRFTNTTARQMLGVISKRGLAASNTT